MTNIEFYRRLLSFNREHDPSFNGVAANTMVYDSVTEAFESLPPEQQAIIKVQQKRLMDRYAHLTELGALEVIASVAEYQESEDK